jgi:WD domain, G-beta repeat
MEDCRARRQVVILDCCFSGAFAAGAKGATDLGLGERFYGQGRGPVVLTASRGSEYSFEGDPVPGSVLPGSVFTGALVAGLRTGAADSDNDGYIYVDDAYAYAFDQVQAAGANQTPQRWLYGAEGKILLARSPAGIATVPTPVPEASGATSTASPTLEKPRAPAERVSRWMPPPRTRRSKVALTAVVALLVATAATAMLVLRTGTGSGRSAARGSPTGHTDDVTSVAFSPDSKLLASASLDHTVRLWNPRTGEPIGQPLSGHTGHVRSVAFSPDGKLLASGSEDDTVRLWNPASGKAIRRPLTGHTGNVTVVAFSPYGKLLASGSEDTTVRLWNRATGQAVGRPSPMVAAASSAWRSVPTASSSPPAPTTSSYGCGIPPPAD